MCFTGDPAGTSDAYGTYIFKAGAVHTAIEPIFSYTGFWARSTPLSSRWGPIFWLDYMGMQYRRSRKRKKILVPSLKHGSIPSRTGDPARTDRSSRLSPIQRSFEVVYYSTYVHSNSRIIPNIPVTAAPPHRLFQIVRSTMDGGALSNIRRARNRRTRETPLHELYAPPPLQSASSGTLASPAQQLFCGADLGLDDSYDSDGHDEGGLHGRPQMLPTAPERAPPPRKRTRRSNGCGAHVHGAGIAALTPDTNPYTAVVHETWAVRTEGVSGGVVPLEARYFTGEAASRLRIGEREACGCCVEVCGGREKS
ncbi:hypothetical protein C8J57DRAFT_1468452 [Mycena rebaudengoi]|nr:hypothetical protein C8J57DRAFT_1468452 [Mycena rebaudengoi]